MPPPCSMLLVGEGNFSFSASLSQSSSITATCLQRQDEALRQEGAAANVQSIRDSGGTVLFEVDCTKLEECSSLQGRMFDRILFNFPHCGRKSGVKKNRELLRSFFLSCVGVLADDGEVHVSLCNGQGGTPADQPRREWHNSWQIAAMAAEAQLILSDVCHFESERYQSYKCTGYRSQDKGFHVEKALLHIFTRSLPYIPTRTLKVVEEVDGEEVQYNVPAELSDYIYRDFLCSGSVHPVKLVQDYLLDGLAEEWPVSMTNKAIPFLIKAERVQTCCQDVDSSHHYWMRLHQKDADPKEEDECADGRGATDAPPASEKLRSKGAACDLDGDLEGESDVYMLRPSLLPYLEEELRTKQENNAGKLLRKGEEKEEEQEKSCGVSNGVAHSLRGTSGLVFRNVPVHLWSLPVFHQLLLLGDAPSGCEPIRSLQQALETVLAPHGVSITTEGEGVCLTAPPMGLVGKVFTSSAGDDSSRVSVTVSLNLDLLAALLFSLSDWRLLWSRDGRFLEQFKRHPPPGTPFQPFSLFPEHFSFDISFWTGPTWEERRFRAMVREASHGTVENIKLIDNFSHPDLSQTSFCYRLVYCSNTHALSHTHALKFHKHLESLLSSRLQVTIR